MKFGSVIHTNCNLPAANCSPYGSKPLERIVLFFYGFKVVIGNFFQSLDDLFFCAPRGFVAHQKTDSI